MKYIILISLQLATLLSFAQTTGTTILDVGLIQEGYTLFAPLNKDTTYLINNCGDVINKWASEYSPGDEVILDNDGNLWRAGRTIGVDLVGAGGRGGIIELFNWEGDLIWSYERCNTLECMHHDFELLPNGNLLVLIWDAFSIEQSTAAGASPDSLANLEGIWSEYLVELTPNLEVDNEATEVWKWQAWDHLIQDVDMTKSNFGVVADHPEKININYRLTNIDWLHGNAIDYNADLDQIILSVPHFDEFWIIDHNSTTEEASTDAGDLLYRWGNPASYDSGTQEDQQLFFMHNPHWVPSDRRFGGEIILFNNRKMINGAQNSAVTVVNPAVDDEGNYLMSNDQFLPESPTYEFVLPLELSSDKVSGAQVQENGNILICSGTKGTLLEIDENDQTAWKYLLPLQASGQFTAQGDEAPSNWIFRAYKYTANFDGFEGKDLTPGNPLELNPEGSFCRINYIEDYTENGMSIFPNPALTELNLVFDSAPEKIEIVTSTGKIMNDYNPAITSVLNISEYPTGVYFIRTYALNGSVYTKRFVKN